MAESKPKKPCKACGEPNGQMPDYCDECGLNVLDHMRDRLNEKVSILPQHCTDLGNMERLVARYGDTFRFTKAAGWWHYDKTNWKSDDTGKINEAAYTTARRIRGEALKVKDKDDPAEAAKHKDTLIKWSKASEAQARLHAMVIQQRGG